MNWSKWDAEHGSGGGGVSSADKIAAQIRGALGPGKMDTPKVAFTKGKSGSTISRAQEARSSAAHVLKKDMKRPAPVKGEKDAADAFRTKIRMAAYNEKKKAAAAADPVNKHTPHTEEELNPHKAPDAAAHAKYKEAAAKAHKVSMAATTVEGKNDPAAHKSAAAAHEQAARLATKSFDRGYHEKAAKQYHESAARAQQVKDTAYGKYTDAMLKAATASQQARTDKTAASHMKAAYAHGNAANLATTVKDRKFHDSGVTHHTSMASHYNASATKKVAAKKVTAPPAAKKAVTAPAKKIAAPPPSASAAKKTAAAAEPTSSHTKTAEEATKTAIASPNYVNHQKAYEAHKAASSATQYGVEGDQAYHQMMSGYHRFAADHPDKVVPAGVNEEHKDAQAAKFPKVADHQLFSSFIDPQSRKQSQSNYSAATKAHQTSLTPGHKSAVSYYTSSGYTKMNGHLRTNAGNASTADEYTADNIKNMDAAFSKQPGLTSDLVTYRGVKESSALFGQVGDKVGGEFVDHGYTSTSSHAHAAGNFGGSAMTGGALLRILHPAGSKLLTPSHVGSFGDKEREMITPRGTRFHIAADRLVTMRNGQQRRVIDLVRK